MRRKPDNFNMDTFKVADFAASILSYTAAGAVFKVFRTVFHADKMVLRQAAFAASPAGSEDFFQQAVATGPLTVGFGKQQFAYFVVESFPS